MHIIPNPNGSFNFGIDRNPGFSRMHVHFNIVFFIAHCVCSMKLHISTTVGNKKLSVEVNG